jgi:transcriptional regulator with XRE-family HTH domain
MASIVSYVGKRMREIRIRKHLTLREVAQHAGVTPSLISQLECGKANPSLSVLSLIANCLEVSVGSLVDGSEIRSDKSPVLHKPDRKTLITKGNARHQLLSQHCDLNCEFIFNEWAPGTAAGSGEVRHEGVECGLLLQGRLKVILGQKSYVLKVGDSITFSSTTPHKIFNPGPEVAVTVWVNSVPWMFKNT